MKWREAREVFTSSWAYFSLCCKVFSLQLSSCAVRRRASNDFAKVCSCRSCCFSVATGAGDILPVFKQYYKRINSSSVKDDPSAKAEAQHNEHKAGSKEKRKEELGKKLEIKCRAKMQPLSETRWPVLGHVTLSEKGKAFYSIE